MSDETQVDRRYRAQEFMKHPETWPCDCCGENRERAILDAEGTGLCVECAVPLLTQQLQGAVEAIREAERLLSGALEPGAIGRPVREFTRGEMADIEMALAALHRAGGHS